MCRKAGERDPDVRQTESKALRYHHKGKATDIGTIEAACSTIASHGMHEAFFLVVSNGRWSETRAGGKIANR